MTNEAKLFILRKSRDCDLFWSMNYIAYCGPECYDKDTGEFFEHPCEGPVQIEEITEEEYRRLTQKTGPLDCRQCWYEREYGDE